MTAQPLDLTRVRALCFDVDGTIADTDDHLVAKLAGVLEAVPLVSGRRAERLARQAVMGLETPVHGAYALLDRLGLDTPVDRLRSRLRAVKAQGCDPAHTRNPQAADEVPHEMVAGVRDRFTAVVGAQTTRRMKPHPEPLFYAAKAMGVDAAECLMVGDTTIDIRTGVAAGAQTVGVLCGFGTERELRLRGAGLILRTTSDLLAVLQPQDDALGKTASPRPKADDRPPRP